MLRYPDRSIRFEKIHAPKYYRRMFYSADLNMYTSFQWDEQCDHKDNTELLMRCAVPELCDEPSAMQMKLVDSIQPQEDADIPSTVLFMQNNASLFIQPYLPQFTVHMRNFECVEFQRVRHNPKPLRHAGTYRDDMEKILVTPAILARKQQMGLTFLETGQVATQLQVNERWGHVMTQLADHTPTSDARIVTVGKLYSFHRRPNGL